MDTPRLLLVAGEASADAHGAEVLASLTAALPGLSCFGLGGQRLRAAGLRPIADGAALNVVGVSEALRRLPAIRRVFGAVVTEAARQRPDAALLLDLPDFNLRLARRLRRLGVPVVYFIAPQAWAWRRGRVRQLRRRVQRLCVIFPFEEEFFRRFGVNAEYVGHPLARLEPSPPAEPPRVALLPGSRPREIERLLPVAAQAARILKEGHPELRFVLAVAPGLDGAALQERLRHAGVVTEAAAGGQQALRGATLALCASGTATLEAALLEVPAVVFYKVSRLTYALVRPIYRLRHVCIVNILAGREVVPELLQGNARPKAVAAAAERLLADGPERAAVLAGYRDIRQRLGSRCPADRVAKIVAECLSGRHAAKPPEAARAP